MTVGEWDNIPAYVIKSPNLDEFTRVGKVINRGTRNAAIFFNTQDGRNIPFSYQS